MHLGNVSMKVVVYQGHRSKVKVKVAWAKSVSVSLVQALSFDRFDLERSVSMYVYILRTINIKFQYHVFLVIVGNV